MLLCIHSIDQDQELTAHEQSAHEVVLPVGRLQNSLRGSVSFIE